jgi:hypothetical protein
MLSWLRRCFSKKSAGTPEWYVISDDVRLALLRSPILEDMFWTSLEIVPLTKPADLRLNDDNFWITGVWEIIDARTDKPVPNVIASSAGIDRPRGRVVLRGVH